MKRKLITLAKDTTLWEAGDAARDVAVIQKGRLGARTEAGLVGLLLPKMVLGESALFEPEGRPTRTATLFAFEDDTEVVLYSAEAVKRAFEDGDDELMRQVVKNLVGQICRNLLMVISAKRGYPFIDEPLKALVQSVVTEAQSAQPIKNWDNMLVTTRFLAGLRDLSDRLLSQLGPDVSQRGDMIVNASQVLQQLQAGRDVLPLVESFLQAEREKNEWWMRGAGR